LREPDPFARQEIEVWQMESGGDSRDGASGGVARRQVRRALSRALSTAGMSVLQTDKTLCIVLGWEREGEPGIEQAR